MRKRTEDSALISVIIRGCVYLSVCGAERFKKKKILEPRVFERFVDRSQVACVT